MDNLIMHTDILHQEMNTENTVLKKKEGCYFVIDDVVNGRFKNVRDSIAEQYIADTPLTYSRIKKVTLTFKKSGEILSEKSKLLYEEWSLDKRRETGQ